MKRTLIGFLLLFLFSIPGLAIEPIPGFNELSMGLWPTMMLVAPPAITGTAQLVTQTLDPCKQYPTIPLSITQAAAGPTKIISGIAGRYIYLCQISLMPGAQSVNLLEGSGTNCATTPITGLFGGTTAATGFVGAAGVPIIIGNGDRTIANTTTTGNDVCIIVSGSGQVSGNVRYIIR